MAQFMFFIDRKVTTWEREIHLVEADSYDQAASKMIEGLSEGVDFSYNLPTYVENDNDFLYDEIVHLHPEDNDGEATVELINPKKVTQPLWHNGKK
jgi:hypothetical protein